MNRYFTREVRHGYDLALIQSANSEELPVVLYLRNLPVVLSHKVIPRLHLVFDYKGL